MDMKYAIMRVKFRFLEAGSTQPDLGPKGAGMRRQ